MNCHFRNFIKMLPCLVLVFLVGSITSNAEEQKKAPAAQTQAQTEEGETPYSEEEYNDYDTACKEPDFQKRSDALFKFLDKYPKSALMQYVKDCYDTLLRETAAAKKYDVLEPIAEKWLKLYPGNVNTLAFIAMATQNLGNNNRCAECMEEIYEKQPQPTLARDILTQYKLSKNLAKQLEWTEKMFKMPEFDTDFGMRYEFVTKYTDSQNFTKAAEYALLTLKSVDLVKDPDDATKDTLKMVRKACNHVIGMHMMGQDKWREAIKAFTMALKAQRYSLGYYLIAQCQEKLEDAETAMITYAKADLLGDPEIASKAKARLELIYKTQHNDTTIGIEKKYRQAKEELANEK
jgi:hypothetical protein